MPSGAWAPPRFRVILANLVDKSMVQVTDGNSPRYRLLETLREYGRLRLGDAAWDQVRARHACWYLDVAERCMAELAGPDEPNAVLVLDREFDNLRAAHSWSIEQGNVDIALRLVASTPRVRISLHAGRDHRLGRYGCSPSRRQRPRTVSRRSRRRRLRPLRSWRPGGCDRALVSAPSVPRTAFRSIVQDWPNGPFAMSGSIGEKYHLLCTGWISWSSLPLRVRQARLAHACYMRSVAYTVLGDSQNGSRFAEMSNDAAQRSGSPTALAQALYAAGVALTATEPEEAKVVLEDAADFAQKRRQSLDSGLCPHRGARARSQPGTTSSSAETL